MLDEHKEEDEQHFEKEVGIIILVRVVLRVLVKIYDKYDAYVLTHLPTNTLNTMKGASNVKLVVDVLDTVDMLGFSPWDNLMYGTCSGGTEVYCMLAEVYPLE